MTEHIRIDKADNILTLTLARPDKKNALTNAMYGVLTDALHAAEADPAVRVIVIRGEGDMFTAGNDVGEFAAMATGAFKGERHVSRFIDALARAGRPQSRPCRGARSASAPRCCCTLTSLCLPKMRNSRRRSSISHWCRRPRPAC